MRIGLVAPPWVPVPPPRYGGTEAVVDALARGLSAAGHDVVLVAAGESTCPVPTRSPLGASAEPMGDGSVEAAYALDAHAALADRDVVHDHTLLGPLLAPGPGGGSGGGSGRRAPALVTTLHLGLTPQVRRIVAAVAQRVPVVAISRAQADQCPEVAFASVIHHGLDPEGFPVGPGDGGYVLFLGRMSADKGPDRAIRLARRAGLPLVLVAKTRLPEEHAFFSDVVRPLLGPDVDFRAEVDVVQRGELLRGARALLNPIRWAEPFGLAMVEALASGTPVLVSPLGAAPEIVSPGPTGALCVDDDAFVAALGDLDRFDRAACRRRFEQHFTAARMVADHVALYERLLAPPDAVRDVDLRDPLPERTSS